MKKTIIFSSLLNIINSTAFASVTDEMKRFQKCYGLMVDQRVSLKDPLWLDVKAGKISGTQACMQIFDRAKLDSNGLVKTSNGIPDDIGMKVLSSFLKFHKSELAINDYGPVIGTGSTDRQTKDITDANEPIYHILLSIFGQNEKWSNTLTRNYSLMGKRYSQYPTRKVSVLNQNFVRFTEGQYITITDENGVSQVIPNESVGGVYDYNPIFAETGRLFGIQPESRNNDFTHPRIKINNRNITSLDPHQHFGAGAIGTQAYLMGNLGRSGLTNGGSAVYRRWGKHVVEDFLCRHQPTLRPTDVRAEVNIESDISFRRGISCMACHSTMDPITGYVRNAFVTLSNNSNLVDGRVRFIGALPQDMPSAPYPVISGDANFHRRPADGRLFYRSYDGTLIDKSSTGLDKLGEDMVSTNDFYVCAAKKYYKFFTGIDVNLADIGDLNTPQFSTGELKQRDRVVEFGLKLKEHQSIRTLVEEIISSEAFIKPDQGV